MPHHTDDHLGARLDDLRTFVRAFGHPELGRATRRLSPDSVASDRRVNIPPIRPEGDHRRDAPNEAEGGGESEADRGARGHDCKLEHVNKLRGK